MTNMNYEIFQINNIIMKYFAVRQAFMARRNPNVT